MRLLRATVAALPSHLQINHLKDIGLPDIVGDMANLITGGRFPLRRLWAEDVALVADLGKGYFKPRVLRLTLPSQAAVSPEAFHQKLQHPSDELEFTSSMDGLRVEGPDREERAAMLRHRMESVQDLRGLSTQIDAQLTGLNDDEETL